ncbi:MAG TPA: hypothetical protein VMR45_03260 [Patescibacteria group bacterium]|nr:hypothetical protein [Patescibacteria group bacterium]
MDNTSKRNLLIIIVVVVVVILGVIALVAVNKSSTTTTDVTSSKSDSYDKNSGQTVSNPAGKTPDTYGTNAAAPIYLGTSNLLDYGVSSDQEADLRYSLYQYFKTTSKNVTEISVTTNSISPVNHDPNSDSNVFTINFDFVVNKKDQYKAKLDYFDLSSIDLHIYDSKGTTQLYDSGTVTSQHL